ncbi:hypothetical protein Ancab_034486 [Ancistrocladus abbreviatus]
MADGLFIRFGKRKLLTLTAIIVTLLVCASKAPGLWILISRLLSPPLVYFILNFIIISILLSSTLSPHFSSFLLKRLSNQSSPLIQSTEQHHGENWCLILEDEEQEHYFTTLNNNNSNEQIHELTSFRRFSNPMLKEEENNAEGAKPPETVEEETETETETDTLEATWKAIMAGKEKETRRQLRKSDTWSVAPLPTAMVETAGGRKELKKFETFREGRGGEGGVRRMEVVLSQDELNRRADAFISKFRGDIWLQRQESDQRFMEMINRGL